MRICILTNRVDDVDPRQTTALLGHVAALHGDDVVFTGVGDLRLTPDDRVVAASRPCPPATWTDKAVAAMKAADPVDVDLGSCDVVLLRTNPGRDSRQALQRSALALARMAQAQGARVVNDPLGLERASSKLYVPLVVPPHLRPRTLVASDEAVLTRFAEEATGPIVLKPLAGSWGRDVFLIRRTDRVNLAAIIDVLCREGSVIAQEFVPEGTSGDVRLIVVDGEMLEVDGKVAAVARVPAPENFRSNIHAGGTAVPALITPAMHAIVEAVGPALVADGIRLAGLDIIGGKVIEINAFATGGFFDAERFGGVGFTEAVLDRLLH